jgi:hypothetical protein
MDDLIYARFINENIGYGTFAKIDLKKGSILG